MRSVHLMLTRRSSVCLGIASVVAVACANSVSASENSIPRSNGTAASNEVGLRAAKWGLNVTVTFATGSMRYRSNGIPNHARQAQYALPNPGVREPNVATSYAGADPTQAQSYDFQIPLVPRRASSPTSTNLGTIGVMISGAALFNPSEGDGVTVAMAFDGYPIYGDRAINGAQIVASQLDQFSGITSPTPEFPEGTYHDERLA